MASAFIVSLLAPLFVSAPPAAEQQIDKEPGKQHSLLLLGGSTTFSEAAPPGLKYPDWVQVFLAPSLPSKPKLTAAASNAGTVKEGRAAARERLAEKPDAIVVGFGLDDALRLSPEEFLREEEGLIDDIVRESPSSKVLLVTSTPLDARHPRAGEERFRQEGGLDAYLQKRFVEPIRELARRKSIVLADHHALFGEAVRAGEPLAGLIEENGSLTNRGNILAARYTAMSLLYLLGRRAAVPTLEEALTGADAPRPPSPARTEGEPLLALWSTELEPRWVARLKDEDPEARIKAQTALIEAGAAPPELLPSLLDHLKQASSTPTLAQSAGKLLNDAVQQGLLPRDQVLPSLLSLIRTEGLGSLAALTGLPLIEQWACGGRAAAPRPPRPGRPVRFAPPAVPVPPSAAEPAAPPSAPEKPTFGPADLDLFVGGLTHREQGIRALSARLLLCAGPAGSERLLAELDKLSEKLALEVLDIAWQPRGERPLVRERVLRMVKDDPREAVRAASLEKILGLPAAEVPLDLLRGLFEQEMGTLRQRAATLLSARGEAGADVLIAGLAAREDERVLLARTGLFFMGLYGVSESTGRKALAALREHFTGEREKQLLTHLAPALERTAPPLACDPAPQTLRIPSRKVAGPQPPRPSRPVQAGSWPIEIQEPQVHRLKEFVPQLTRAFREGTDEEKDAAEAILLKLWRQASAVDVAPRPQQPPATPLAQRLQSEAVQSLKAGDERLFLERARQALAAGAPASAWSSFAWTLATTARDSLRDPVEAERWAKEAIARGGRHPSYLASLAAALAAQGRFEEAQDLELEAIQALPAEENVKPYLARALRYLARKPYREPTREQGN